MEWTLPGALEVTKAGQVLDIDDDFGGLDVVADEVDGVDLHTGLVLVRSDV